MTARRLNSGGRIDRNTPVDFKWDGRSYQGYAGDTLASALLASGEKILGRSFKYHRPRGLMSAGVEESGAIVSVGTGARKEPNVKATMQELYPNLNAKGQNAWPNVRRDFNAINGLFGRFFSAGFYYKTFMGLPPFEWGKGTWLWMQYEKIIRNAAGMGKASRKPDPDKYDHAHGFCDVLVVGSGPAGIAAALELAEKGHDVVLVEQDFELGGDYLNDSDPAVIKNRDKKIAKLEKAGVRIMTRTTAFGLYDHGVAGLVERVNDHIEMPPAYEPRQRFWMMRAAHTILATGALERMIAFSNNDLPGIMTAASARVYLNRFGILPGQRIVIATNNDSAYATAIDLYAAGADVLIADARKDVSITVPNGISVKMGAAPSKAIGRKTIKGVELSRNTANGWVPFSEEPCDLLLVSGGWSPVVNLLSHRGGMPVWDDVQCCFMPNEIDENVTMAGASTGIWGQKDCIASGVAVAKKIDGKKVKMPKAGGWDNPIFPLYEVSTKCKGKAFVDPQHDVTADDIRLAHQEGYVSVEHLKRYTTLGMATDQGKMGNVIGMALMADAIGTDIASVGTTRFRPPYTPIAIGALAGRNVQAHFKPLRRTPLHDWNLRHGAKMTEVGLWQRPWFYPQAGETITQAYIREAKTTRESVGLCDVSSLGKIAVQGPDASEFLNRIYTNLFAKVPVGKARYGIMLRDDGMVMDDGTCWRLSENDFLMTTTTAHAAKVMVWLEELLQTRWPDLRVHVSSISDQWAGIAVAGPQSRETISACIYNPEEISNDSLPFMGVREITFKNDVKCLIARISFSGERAFEVYVPANFGEPVMDMLWKAALSFDGCLYGSEALGTLRIEKGHVTGAELDGRMTIDDAGLGAMASPKKSYIGSQLRQRPVLTQSDRWRLVGIFPKNRDKQFKSGSLLFGNNTKEGFGEGWITAVTHSPALGHWIGIGYIKGGYDKWVDKDVIASDPTRTGDVAVEIVSPHMYDPKGERMHG